MPQIYIASDHAGIKLKSYLIDKASGSEWIDLGPSTDASVDYPDFADLLCSKVLANPGSLGVLICGSGVGMSIAANRHKGIRAALAESIQVAELGREHNNANVLCLGARILDEDHALEVVEAFLEATFSGGERHERRIQKLDQ
jgi:ribose 5-phosphate isomerase B